MTFKSTIYDLLGYFVPGFISIFLFFISFYPANICKETLDSILTYFLTGGIHVILFTIVICYVLGFLFSGLSNIFVFKLLPKIFPSLNAYSDYEKIIDNESLEIIKIKFKGLFSINLCKDNVRLVVNNVENQKPVLYSTALYFMSFYGMASSSFLLLVIFSMVQSIILFIQFNLTLLVILILYLVFSFLFLYQYLRFIRYYNQQIFYSFLAK